MKIFSHQNSISIITQIINSINKNAGILIIGFLGLILRLYNLGKYSFWNDEAGQALAAIQPNIHDFFSIIRNHAMAMPFDYIITRFLSSIYFSEFFLRIPSVIWSVLTIFVIYHTFFHIFFHYQARKFIASTVSFLFAISPIHIYYAQEMRFYSSLAFFYWLSTLVLFLFIKNPNKKLWSLLTAISIIGIFFHPYVLYKCNSIFLVEKY
jgi:uncharacterized membrane protein